MRTKSIVFALVILLSTSSVFALTWDKQKNEPFWNKITTAGTNYDSVLIEAGADVTNYIYRDISYNNSSEQLWQNVFLQGTTGSTTRPLITLESVTSETDLSEARAERQLELQNMSLTDVRFKSEAQLKFTGPDININLDNGDLEFASFFRPNIPDSSTFTINATNGTNRVTEFFTQDAAKAASTINVTSGAKLVYGSSLNDTPGDTQRYEGDFNLKLDNSEFELYYYKLKATNGTANIDNGSTFTINGTDAHFTVANLNLTGGSSYVAGINNLTTVTDTLLLDASSMTLGTSHTMDVETLRLRGTSSITGDSPNNTNLTMNTIQSADASAVDMSFEKVKLTAENLNVSSNATYDILSRTQLYIDNLKMDGGVLNVAAADLTLKKSINTTGTSIIDLVDGALNVEGTTVFDFSALDFRLNDGSLIAAEGGTITGSGVLSGTGDISVLGDDKPGVFSPGTAANPYGTISTDANVSFYTLQLFRDESFLNNSAGLFDAGIYQVDVGVDGGLNPQNDQLLYGAGDVSIQQLKELNVRVQGAPTASDLHGKDFTVIQAQGGGVAGTIQRYGQTINLVEDGNVPALVNFTLLDLNTGGKSDVTLQADANLNNLIQHPQATSKNRQGSANLLVNAANSGNTAAAASLNTLTNAQVAQHLESVHAEPYSSYMTISLEHTDMVMNTVLNHAARDGVFSTGRSYKSAQSGTRKQYWASAEGMASATDAVVETSRPETLKRTWMDVSYNEGDVDGDDDLGDFEYNLFSLTIGQDLVATDDKTLGAFFSFGTQEMDEHDNAVQDFDGDIYNLGLYLNAADVGGWDLRGVLGYAYGDHDSRRTVVLSNSIATPSAGFDSHSAYVGVKGTVIGYQNNWVTLEPELGLNYTYYKQDSLKESGDPNLSLKVDSEDAQAIIASAGVNARFASLSQTNSIYPLAFVRYEYDAYADSNNDHEVDAALVAHPEYKQTFVGQNRGEHAFIGGLGLGSDLTSALQIRGGLRYTDHSHGDEWGAGLNMQYLW